MLCSARELGLGADHEGIMALDVDVSPGTKFLDAMPVGDVRLVVDVLPNRPDLLSHEGLAREIAAEKKVPLNDLRKAFVAYWKEHNQENKPHGYLTYDGNHFNQTGHDFVAEQMLKKLK